MKGGIMKKISFKNTAAMVLLTLCLGATVGLVLWLFLRAAALGVSFVWKMLPARTAAP